MDFVTDALFDGRGFRALTVVDKFTKESLAIEVDQQLKGKDVVAVVERLKYQRGVPQRIQTDNGSEFISITMGCCAYDHALAMDLSRPGRSTDNPFFESATGASATSASTRTRSCRSTVPATRSKPGDRIVITSAHTLRSAMSRQPSSRHSSSNPNRKIFQFWLALLREGVTSKTFPNIRGSGARLSFLQVRRCLCVDRYVEER